MRGLKPPTDSNGVQDGDVASSRVRGLKQEQYDTYESLGFVASSRVRGLKRPGLRRALHFRGCRILAGAWIETSYRLYFCRIIPVASSRVRGLKQQIIRSTTAPVVVASSRVRGLKPNVEFSERRLKKRRILAGAWIETSTDSYDTKAIVVASSRVRGLKLNITFCHLVIYDVASSRVRGLKLAQWGQP